MKITTTNLTFSYTPNLFVLKAVDLDLPEGRIIGIAGPNGAGKSTFLKLAATILSPDEGEIRLDDRPLKSYGRRELAQKVAWVPQESTTPFPLTVTQIVTLGRYPSLGPFSSFTLRDREAVTEAMELMSITHLASKTIQTLSGGERRRVFLARAVAARPKVYLLDEPFAHLDPAHQQRMAEIILSMNKRGDTVIVVSHLINFLLQTCHEIVLLKEGRREGHLKDPAEFTRSTTWEKLFASSFDRAEGKRGRYLFPAIEVEGNRRP